MGNKYRSKFEATIAKQLTNNGIKFDYETIKLAFKTKVNCDPCIQCGNTTLLTSRTYLADFNLGTQLILEVKGILDRAERKKFVAIKEYNPTIDIRFIFQRDNRIYRGSDTRYSDWAIKNEFKYCIGSISKQWLKEFKNGTYG